MKWIVAIIFVFCCTVSIQAGSEEAKQSLRNMGYSDVTQLSAVPAYLVGPIIPVISIGPDGEVASDVGGEFIGRINSDFVTITGHNYVITATFAGKKEGRQWVLVVGPQILMNVTDATEQMANYGRFLLQVYFGESGKSVRMLIK
jgi:hypothetical protein